MYPPLKKLLLSLLILAIVVAAVKAEEESETSKPIQKAFQWHFQEKDYSLTYTFNPAVYRYYKILQRSQTSYADYLIEYAGYYFIDEFTAAFEREGTNHKLEDWDIVNLAIDFVQQLQYVPDENGNYPKYPIETLVEGGGDCEDTSILLAAIIRELGYDCVLVTPPGHMAVGLACQGCDGAYYPKNGHEYYYVETAAPGWEIGDIPDSQVRAAKLIEIRN